MNRYEDLRRKIDYHQRAPQSVVHEEARTWLELELEELLAKRTLRVIARTRLLLHAYDKIGSMTVIYPNGTNRTERPIVTNNAVQNYWNIKHLARDLSNASIPYE